jgi:mycofactocin precursor
MTDQPSSAARRADRPETAAGAAVAAGAVVAPAIDEPLVEQELLVEDVSIDGMCGVY